MQTSCVSDRQIVEQSTIAPPGGQTSTAPKGLFKDILRPAPSMLLWVEDGGLAVPRPALEKERADF